MSEDSHVTPQQLKPIFEQSYKDCCRRCDEGKELLEEPDQDGIYWHRTEFGVRECNASIIRRLYEDIKKA